METRRVETPRSRDRETSAFYGAHQGRGFRCLLAANTDKVSALALSTEEYFCGQLDKNSRRAGAGPSLVRAVSLLLRRVASVQPSPAQPSPAQPSPAVTRILITNFSSSFGLMTMKDSKDLCVSVVI